MDKPPVAFERRCIPRWTALPTWARKVNITESHVFFTRHIPKASLFVAFRTNAGWPGPERQEFGFVRSWLGLYRVGLGSVAGSGHIAAASVLLPCLGRPPPSAACSAVSRFSSRSLAMPPFRSGVHRGCRPGPPDGLPRLGRGDGQTHLRSPGRPRRPVGGGNRRPHSCGPGHILRLPILPCHQFATATGAGTGTAVALASPTRASAASIPPPQSCMTAHTNPASSRATATAAIWPLFRNANLSNTL